jgi:SAM-dependent methyltransferase
LSEARANGALPVAREALRFVTRYATGFPRAAMGRSSTFRFDGSELHYLAHTHRWTWLTERAVEVPIAREAIARTGGGRVLEVGNVLGHYGSHRHLVLDRYERAPGVINRDVLEFEDSAGFDLIVTVSTLEHVGWDERPRVPGGAARAYQHLTGLVKPGGKLVATVPVGYNPEFDRAIRKQEIELSAFGALRRDMRRNVWHEVDPDAIWDVRYDELLCTAHGVVVCTYERPAG